MFMITRDLTRLELDELEPGFGKTVRGRLNMDGMNMTYEIETEGHIADCVVNVKTGVQE
jgi:hypothetical protein